MRRYDWSKVSRSSLEALAHDVVHNAGRISEAANRVRDEASVKTRVELAAEVLALIVDKKNTHSFGVDSTKKEFTVESGNYERIYSLVRQWRDTPEDP